MVRFRLWRNLSDESGLTLIELLGVALIMLLLALVAVPVYAGITDKARFTQSMANLRNIEQALERHKAEFGYYPNRLQYLVDRGYLKSSASFESAWSNSSENRVYLFYAVDRPERSQAFILADPGLNAGGTGDCTDKNGKVIHDTTLHTSFDEPFPCGRQPADEARHWLTSATPKLTLEPHPDELPDSLRAHRLDCDPFTPKTVKRKKVARTVMEQVQCVYKAEK